MAVNRHSSTLAESHVERIELLGLTAKPETESSAQVGHYGGAFSACTTLNPVYRRLVQLALEELLM